jgi:hypothetical protein
MVCLCERMTKKADITAKEELQQMLERIRQENDALEQLIKALKEQSTPVDNKFQKKSNQ